MAYADMDPADLILLAVEFVGRGGTIPDEIAAALGPDLISDIQHPETNNGHTDTG